MSNSHIFAPRHDAIRPKAVFWKGASLITCKRRQVRIGEQGSLDTKRGKITQFSAKSRRRLMYTVAKLRKTEMPMFITLTYPGE